MPITIVIADHEKKRSADCLRYLETTKGIRVIGAARGGVQTLALVAKLKPRILLLDVELSKEKGVSLIEILRQLSPETKVILVGSASENRILDELSRGAKGYLDEEQLITSLTKAVRLVHAGETWIARKLIAKIVSRLLRASRSSRA